MHKPSAVTTLSKAPEAPMKDLLCWVLGVCLSEGITPLTVCVSVEITSPDLPVPVRCATEYTA